MLDAEADALCGAQRYERSPDWVDARAGSYERQFYTKAGKVTLKMSKLRKQTFETAIIERYRRREASVKLIISNTCPWLVESGAEYYPAANWQRCPFTSTATFLAVCRTPGSSKWPTCSRPSHAQESLGVAQKAQAMTKQLRQRNSPRPLICSSNPSVK